MHIPMLADHVRVVDEAGLFLVLRVDHEQKCADLLRVKGHSTLAFTASFERLMPEEEAPASAGAPEITPATERGHPPKARAWLLSRRGSSPPLAAALL